MHFDCLQDRQLQLVHAFEYSAPDAQDRADDTLQAWCDVEDFAVERENSLQAIVANLVWENGPWIRAEYRQTGAIARAFFPLVDEDTMTSLILPVVDPALWEAGYSPVFNDPDGEARQAEDPCCERKDGSAP